jgi:hypothetical protein
MNKLLIIFILLLACLPVKGQAGNQKDSTMFKGVYVNSHILEPEAIKIALNHSSRLLATSETQFVVNDEWKIITYKEAYAVGNRAKACYKKSIIITIDATKGKVKRKRRRKIYCVSYTTQF